MNIAYKYNTWLEIMRACKSSFDFGLAKEENFLGNFKSFWQGYPVLYTKENVIIFKQCDYCLSKDGNVKEALYESGFVCSHCGAPITSVLRGKK